MLLGKNKVINNDGIKTNIEILRIFLKIILAFSENESYAVGFSHYTIILNIIEKTKPNPKIADKIINSVEILSKIINK